MKAQVTGVSAWQGTPTDGLLDIEVLGRYVDSSGNAAVSHYTGQLSADKTRWVEPGTQTPLWIVVQGPDDPHGTQAIFTETLSYGPQKVVRTKFARRLISSDLAGLFFDYAAPEPGLPVGFDDAPLSLRAAAEVIAMAPVLEQARVESVAGTARANAAADKLGAAGLVYVGNDPDGSANLLVLGTSSGATLTYANEVVPLVGTISVPTLVIA